jgi:hypothetical protein
MSFWAEAFIGTMIIILVVFAADLLLKITGETILCCIKVYEFISKKISSSSTRTTSVIPISIIPTITPVSSIKINPIEQMNYIVIENPNTRECNKYAIGVVIKN